MEKSYEPIARKYRPKRFCDLVGQDAIVKTLKNALRTNKTAPAYLFCGSRGTGKTSIARLLAKALNCSNLTEDQEPCNQCPSCQDVLLGRPLDVLEIDGASNRGIDDIRQINETVGYAASSGKYKIYIIDEVHMLTKEAFNALLKTIEEPPAKVKFFFATTESNKVPPTIISRCQRFDLARISLEQIVKTLTAITLDLGQTADPAALFMIAKASDGALRDAQALLDQLLCFSSGNVTVESVSSALGLVPHTLFFALDKAIFEQNLPFALSLTAELFAKGYDLALFQEFLVEHFRTHLHIKLSGALPNDLDKELGKTYLAHSENYTKGQCLYIVDQLIASLKSHSKSPFARVHLEMLLLNLIRSKYRLSLDEIAKKLLELESSAKQAPQTPLKEPAKENKLAATTPTASISQIVTEPLVTAAPAVVAAASTPAVSNRSLLDKENKMAATTPTASISQIVTEPLVTAAPAVVAAASTPAVSDRSLLDKVRAQIEKAEASKAAPVTAAVETPKPNPVAKETEKAEAPTPNSARHETLLRFAAVVLEGSLKK